MEAGREIGSWRRSAVRNPTVLPYRTWATPVWTLVVKTSSPTPPAAFLANKPADDGGSVHPPATGPLPIREFREILKRQPFESRTRMGAVVTFEEECDRSSAFDPRPSSPKSIANWTLACER